MVTLVSAVWKSALVISRFIYRSLFTGYMVSKSYTGIKTTKVFYYLGLFNFDILQETFKD